MFEWALWWYEINQAEARVQPLHALTIRLINSMTKVMEQAVKVC